MKKFKNIILLALLACVLGACSDEKLDSNTIFPTDPPERNDFDEWILKEYTNPYNIDFKYRLDDMESDHDYTLAPAERDKSIALAKLILYLWIDAYNEVMGPNFIKQYVPRVIHLIGSAAYETNNTMVLGTAEGGLKVTLYLVNSLDLNDLSLPFLNTYFFKTMHHEFAHILTQYKDYDSETFQQISMADYQSSNWYQFTDAQAHAKGFVSNYAMSEYNEDFAENIAIYITSTEAAWNAILNAAGTTGRPILLRKFQIVYEYLLDVWGLDLNDIRDAVQWRSKDINDLDLTLPSN